MTPWETALSIPSAHGLAADTFAHLCGGPGAYVISAPLYFLLARPVKLDAPESELRNPYSRWPDHECDAWLLSVVAGDACAAYHALVDIAGHRRYVCWESANGVKVRKSDDRFLKRLHAIRVHKYGQGLSRQFRRHQAPAAIAGGVEAAKQGHAGPVAAAGGHSEDSTPSEDRSAHATA